MFIDLNYLIYRELNPQNPIKKLLQHFIDSCDKSKHSSTVISKPTIVQLGIQINSFYSISEATMVFILLGTHLFIFTTSNINLRLFFKQNICVNINSFFS